MVNKFLCIWFHSDSITYPGGYATDATDVYAILFEQDVYCTGATGLHYALNLIY